MTALAAARLGYRCHVYCQQPDSPTEQVAAAATVAPFDDLDALARFAAAVDVVTFEFENVPAESARHLAERVCLRPGWNCLRLCRHRVVEKRFLNDIGVATAPFRAVNGADDLARAAADLGRPAVLKTCTLGYDGKGQARIGPETDLAAAWTALDRDEAILEAFVDFEREVSVIVARGPDGATAPYDPVENMHENHVLARTLAPAPVAPDLVRAATETARHIAQEMDLVGLLAVEMFVTRDGRLLVNELAPRPHNSGHWTLDACVTSQFEQFVRAVCGLPLGRPDRHSDAEMQNLLGDAAEDWAAILADPDAKLHLYGKGDARPGRKMGHVTWIRPRA